MPDSVKNPFIAYSWPEYESQGPSYKILSDWWKQNAINLPGEFDSSYQSWTKWYREKYNTSWGHQHMNPEDVLKILKESVPEVNNSIMKNIQHRTQRLLNIKKDDEAKPDLSNPIKFGPSNYKGLVGVKLGADVDGTSEAVKSFLATLGKLAKTKGYQKPFVTSGHRSTRGQIRAMANNWNKNGANKVVTDDVAKRSAKNENTINRIRNLTQAPINLGLIYLFELYQDKEMVIHINEIFVELGTNRQGLKAASEYWDAMGRQSSAHLRTPAEAVDLRQTDGILELLNLIKDSGRFNMKLISESDHYHVRIYS